MEFSSLLIILIALLFSGFFSGMEIAFVSANKMMITLDSKEGNLSSRLIAKMSENPSRFIASMLVGNNMALVVYGVYMGEFIIHILFPQYSENQPMWVLLIQTMLSTLLILLVAEFLPKIIFNIYPNKLLKLFAIPIYVLYQTFYLITECVLWISKITLSLFGVKEEKNKSVFDKSDLANLIQEKTEGVESDKLDSEIQIFQNALEFSDLKARECMVPRNEMIAVIETESIEVLTRKFIETGLSKIIIYGENIDDVKGYVHSFELFKNPKNIQSVLLPVEFIPETVMVKDVFDKLTKKQRSIAIVLDEYGGTSGLITLEDIIEELFGEIEDEHDSLNLEEEIISENVFKFSARLEVDYLNDKFKLNLPEEDAYETLGGMIMNYSQNIPSVGDEFTIEDVQIEILETSSSKIELVLLNKIKQD